MRLGDSPDDRQAEAAARARRGVVRAGFPMESLEYALARIDGNARSRVADRQHRLARLFGDGDVDPASARAYSAARCRAGSRAALRDSPHRPARDLRRLRAAEVDSPAPRRAARGRRSPRWQARTRSTREKLRDSPSGSSRAIVSSCSTSRDVRATPSFRSSMAAARAGGSAARSACRPAAPARRAACAIRARRRP